jgi:hypothetical protein
MMSSWLRDYLGNLPVLLEVGFTGSSIEHISLWQKPKKKGMVGFRRKVELTSEGIEFLRILKQTNALSIYQVHKIFDRGGAP